MDLVVTAAPVERLTRSRFGQPLATLPTRHTRTRRVNELNGNTRPGCFVRDLFLQQPIWPIVDRICSCLAIVGQLFQCQIINESAVNKVSDIYCSGHINVTPAMHLLLIMMSTDSPQRRATSATANAIGPGERGTETRSHDKPETGPERKANDLSPENSRWNPDEVGRPYSLKCGQATLGVYKGKGRPRYDSSVTSHSYADFLGLHTIEYRSLKPNIKWGNVTDYEVVI